MSAGADGYFPVFSGKLHSDSNTGGKSEDGWWRFVASWAKWRGTSSRRGTFHWHGTSMGAGIIHWWGGRVNTGAPCCLLLLLGPTSATLDVAAYD